jgi:replicative DNA helicase
MTEITGRTEKIAHSLFSRAQAIELCEILRSRCSGKDVHSAHFSAEEMERIHLSVLKLVGENAMDVESAIRLAQTDWRDLLMTADFGEIEAHDRWAREHVS